MRWLLVIALAACGSTKPAGGGGAVPTKAELDSCSRDEDCTLAEACCGCGAGGRKTAIRVDAVKDYEASRPQRCGGEVCPAVMSTHPSCDAEAICGQNGRCTVAPHMQHQ